MQYEWRKAELIGQLLNLGVTPGGVLLVHSSFRSVRPLEDGPLGLIEALRAALGPGGTLVMPSWSGLDDEPFDPATSPVTPDLGVVSDTFWRLPNVKRSAHPFAFAAAGPQAEQIISDPLPLPPHSPASPVARVHELDGQVLLLGVGHDANTTLHLAELMAKVPYGVPRHCTILRMASWYASIISRMTTAVSALPWRTGGSRRRAFRRKVQSVMPLLG